MALMYKACWEGYYKSRYKTSGEWVPAMVILPGKKLTEDELKDSDSWR